MSFAQNPQPENKNLLGNDRSEQLKQVTHTEHYMTLICDPLIAC